MGTVYAIANQKGGVGKTTTAVNVAACIAEAGYETLLVDIDPQANATVGLGLPKDREPSIYDVLARRRDGRGRARRRPASTACTLLPSHPDLAGANVELPREAGSEQRLREALAPLRDRFAYMLLDCPPSLGPADGQRARRGRPRDRPGPDRVLRARGPRRPARHARARSSASSTRASPSPACC